MQRHRPSLPDPDHAGAGKSYKLSSSSITRLPKILGGIFYAKRKTKNYD